jgi:D-sedoheptulose 7-phosphate isomerase
VAGCDGAEHVRRRVVESAAVFGQMLDDECIELAAEAAERIVAALRIGHRVVFFGNGGSSSDAGHLAGELLGRFAYHRPPLPAVSLPDSTAALTAISNDYEFAEVFARQLLGLCGPGDVAVGLSTSGCSPNVVRALEAARDAGLVTVALTGAGGGRLAGLVDVCIQVPTGDTPRVQEACMHLGHSICELVERRMFPVG